MQRISASVYKGTSKHITSLLINTVYAYCIYVISTKNLSIPQIELTQVLFTAAMFAIAYNAIYYINSYSDRVEDRGIKSVNIYLDRYSSMTYWGMFTILIASVSLILRKYFESSSLALFVFILLYQVCYSLPPIRFKRIKAIRYIALGVFYVLKTYFIYTLFSIPITLNSIIFLLYIFLIVTMGSMVYKAKFYKKKKKLPKVGFGTSLLLFSTFTFLAYWWFGKSWLFVIEYIAVYLLAAFVFTGFRELFIKRFKSYT